MAIDQPVTENQICLNIASDQLRKVLYIKSGHGKIERFIYKKDLVPIYSPDDSLGLCNLFSILGHTKKPPSKFDESIVDGPNFSFI